MPSLVSRVDGFCNFALDGGFEVGSSVPFVAAIRACWSFHRSHMWRPPCLFEIAAK
jgi:hypothetical protein